MRLGDDWDTVPGIRDDAAPFRSYTGRTPYRPGDEHDAAPFRSYTGRTPYRPGDEHDAAPPRLYRPFRIRRWLPPGACYSLTCTPESGKIRVLGKLWWIIVHQDFPRTRNFPGKWPGERLRCITARTGITGNRTGPPPGQGTMPHRSDHGGDGVTEGRGHGLGLDIVNDRPSVGSLGRLGRLEKPRLAGS
jgi:hypothetical protein